MLDGRAAPLRGTADVEFRSLKLAELFPTVEAMKKARGFAHGRARLAGTGDSVAALLGSADGRVSLAVDRGTISNLVLELLGLDVAEAVLLFATGDKEVPIHCAVADLGVARGIGTTDVFVLDTADTLVVGAGVVDFRREQLDLTLSCSQDKRPSPRARRCMSAGRCAIPPCGRTLRPWPRAALARRCSRLSIRCWRLRRSSKPDPARTANAAGWLPQPKTGAPSRPRPHLGTADRRYCGGKPDCVGKGIGSRPVRGLGRGDLALRQPRKASSASAHGEP